MPKYIYILRNVITSTCVLEAPDEESAQQWMDEREDDSAFRNEKLIDSVVHLTSVFEGHVELPADVIVDPCDNCGEALRRSGDEYDGLCPSCADGKFVQYELEDLP